MINCNYKDIYTSVQWILLITVAVAAGCNTQSNNLDNPLPAEKFSAAIKRVLAEDEEMGARRNHACEENSLSFAIDRYLNDIDSIDWQDCPVQFTDAFKMHRDAWEKSKQLFDKFPDLRGEMHDLFDILREKPESQEALLQVEKDIWGSWAEVEKAALEYGVGKKAATPDGD